MKNIFRLLLILCLVLCITTAFALPSSPTGADLQTPPEVSNLEIKGEEQAWLQIYISSPANVRNAALFMEAVDGDLGRFDHIEMNVSIDGEEYKEVPITLAEGNQDRLEGLYKSENIEGLHLDSNVKAKARYVWTIPETGIRNGDWSIELEVSKASNETTSEIVATEPTNETTDEKSYINAHDWAMEELIEAGENGLIPDILRQKDLSSNITRQEFAHVAVKIWEKLSGSTMEPGPKDPFTDTHDPEILKAYNLEITNGTSNTTFSPEKLITREEMATMILRAVVKAHINPLWDSDKIEKYADDNEMHLWGREAIYFLSFRNVIKGIGDNKFGVNSNATREQSLVIAIRALKNVK